MTDLRKVDVNLLVLLDAILAEQNLTRVAEDLGMTQPAVSGALARLRQQFDDPLIVREGKKSVLTERAQELIPLVREAMTEVSRLLELSPTFDEATSTRTFMISGSDYVLAQMTPILLGLLATKAPSVHIEFDYLPIDARVTPDDLLRRDVIIAGHGTGLPGKKQSLFSDRFVCIVSADNTRLKKGKLTTDDLCELGQVRSYFGDNITTLIDEMLLEAGVEPRVTTSVQGFLPLPHLVAGTQYFAFVPELLATQLAEPLGLVVADTGIKAATLVEAAHWHPSKTGDPAISWLVALLREASELLEFGADA